MAALAVFQQVGKIADTEFLAVEILPLLWAFSLGPLLNLEQFQAFMQTIKQLSARIEQEHTAKLQRLNRNNTATQTNRAINGSSANGEEDFESLVTGRKTQSTSTGDPFGGALSPSPAKPPISPPRSSTNSQTFSWQQSLKPPGIGQQRPSGLSAQDLSTRAVTPDINAKSFAALAPSSSVQAMALQQTKPLPMNQMGTKQQMKSNNDSQSGGTSNPWSNNSAPSIPLTKFGQTSFAPSNAMSNLSIGSPPRASSPWDDFQDDSSTAAWAGTENGSGQDVDKYGSLI